MTRRRLRLREPCGAGCGMRCKMRVVVINVCLLYTRTYWMTFESTVPVLLSLLDGVLIALVIRTLSAARLATE